MITATEVGPGSWQFASVWKKGVTIKVTLKLQDTDGDVDEREVEWEATEDMLPFEALKNVAQRVDSEPFWQASSFGSFLKINPTNPLNQGLVSLSITQP